MKITTPSLEEVCEFLCHSAIEIGGLLMSSFGTAGLATKEVEQREKGSFTKEAFTGADITSQKLMIMRTEAEVLFDAYVLAEEKTPIDKRFQEQRQGQKRNAFVYDCLDGTHNFTQKSHMFGVSLGFMDGNDFKAGVVYLPLEKRMYYAVEGKGAFSWRFGAGSRRVQLRKSSSNRIAVSSKTPEQVLQGIREKGFDWEMHKSSAYSVAQILDGKINAHSTIKSNIWDIGPGFYIVRQAGGVVCDIKGESFAFDRAPESQIGKAQFFAFDSERSKELLLPIFAVYKPQQSQ
jgi:fructose-1,6-bisphosphatase/inositol monophosphatase family enzyme